MELTASDAMFGTRPTRRFEAITWASAAMRSLELDIICARTLDCNVLISGEPGVGKGAVVQRLHRQSRRGAQSLVIIRAPDVLSSTKSLAVRLLEASPDGTILLENPHTASPRVQSRLLHFVERRSGLAHAHRSAAQGHDVRFLTTTSCDLFGLVQHDRFCESLFYRLNPIHLIIPPLRTRPEDIGVLVEYFFSIHAGATRPRLSAEAWERIVTYSWPGNVRELRELVAALAARDLPRPVALEDLPHYMLGW